MRGDKPTLKQKLFAAEYVRNGGNGVRAAQATYKSGSYRNAKLLAHYNLKKPVIQKEISAILDEVGLSRRSVVEKLREAVGNGMGVKATQDTSLRAIDMILRLYNAYPDKKNIQLAYSFKTKVTQQDFEAVKKQLATLNERVGTLLSETKST